jgi:hypothetical protein
MGRSFRDDDRRYIMEDSGGDTRPSGGALEPSGSSSPELRSRALQGAVAYVYLLKGNGGPYPGQILMGNDPYWASGSASLFFFKVVGGGADRWFPGQDKGQNGVVALQ